MIQLQESDPLGEINFPADNPDPPPDDKSLIFSQISQSAAAPPIIGGNSLIQISGDNTKQEFLQLSQLDFLNQQYVGQPIELKSLSPNNSFHQFEVVGEYNIYDGTLSSSAGAGDTSPVSGISSEPVQHQPQQTVFTQEIKTENPSDAYNIYSEQLSSPEHYNYQEAGDSDFTTSTTTTVLILNPDGSLSNEFTVGEGINLEDIKQELYNELTPPRATSTVHPPKSSPIPLDLSSQSIPTLPPLSSITCSNYSPLPSISSLIQSSGNAININNSTINISQSNILLPTQPVFSNFNFTSTQNNFTSTQNNFTLPVKNIHTNSASAVSAITSPLPRHAVLSENNSLKFSQVPRNVIDSALGGINTLKTSPTREIKSPEHTYGRSQPVFLHQKENIYLLEELNRLPTHPVSPETLGVSHVPPAQTKILSTFVPAEAARGENGLKMKQRITKISQNSAPYKKPSRAKSIGAIGQALHGLHGKQVCPLCKFEATTKNPYRHLQDHLARIHFKDRLARELPSSKPFKCPVSDCEAKCYPDWQAVMRHYIGNKHGILERYVRESLAATGGGPGPGVRL